MPDNKVISQDLNTDLYLRRRFFEDAAAEALSAEELSQGARLLGMDLPGQSCAVAVFSMPPEPRQTEDYFSGPAAIRGRLMAHFLKYSEYLAFPWGPTAYAAVVLGPADLMPGLIDRCVAAVRSAYESAPALMPWHIAVSDTAQGLERLPELLRQGDRLWAMRYFRPEAHILRGDIDAPADNAPAGDPLRELDPRLADPSVVRSFLERGRAEDIPAFAAWYAQTALGGARSRPVRDYGIVSSLMAAKGYALSLGLSDSAVEEAFAALEPADWSGAGLEGFLAELLDRALSLRADSGAPERGSFSLALEFVNGHLTEPELSLDAAAQAADMNPAYLSALFRRKTGQTFTDYVTQRRVESARRLLLSTDDRPGQIAEAVGYRDRHYFSVVFKKVQGCTPTQFRAKNRR